MAKINYDVRGVGTCRDKPPRSVQSKKSRPAGAPPPLDVDDRFGLAGEVVQALAPWTEADPAALLLDFLTTFGAAAGSLPHIQVGYDRHEPRTFTVVVGPSGLGRKGSSRTAVRRLFDLVDPEWSAGCVARGLSSGEGLIEALSANSSKRLLVEESEFGRVLKVASRSGSIISEVLRDLWDRKSVHVMNRSAYGIDDASLTLIGHVTVDELRKQMGSSVDLTNGFANRILWVFSQRMKLIPGGEPMPEERLVRLARRVEERLAKAREIDVVVRSRAAEKLWQERYIELEERAASGLVGEVTERRAAQMVRLSLIFAILESRNQIEPEDIQAAELVWKYCEASARFLFGESTGWGPADKAMTYLHHCGGTALRSEVRSGAFSNNTDERKLGAVRDHLVEHGLIHVSERRGKGRPAEVWALTEGSEP